MAAVARRYGAVAAGHPVTAGVAADLLRAGANAFDAAIAALWSACVAEPVLASPAGGGFMIARTADGEPEVFDFFGHTPRAAPAAGAALKAVKADFGTATQEFHIGAGAVAAPGFVPGLFAVHEAYGEAAMVDLVRPAARLARGGVEVTPFQARLFEIVRPILESEADARALFAPADRLLEAGATFRNPALGDTLEALAREGAGLISWGALAREVVEAVEAGGGSLSLDDLATYAVARREPLRRRLGDTVLWTNPPPAAGGVLMLLILALADGAGDPASFAQAIDRVDRLRRDGAFDDREVTGDLGVVFGEIAGHQAPRGTTHVSVIDAAGNAAAASVSNGAGNGQIVAGFMLNDMLGEEDLSPAGLGTWTPGTRLASMMAPTLLERRGLAVALGSGGSNRIRSAIARVVAGLAAGVPLADAISAPRIHVEAGHLDFEDFLPADARGALTSHFPDHRAWRERSLYFGGVHAAARLDDGRFEAVGDRRRGGAGLVVEG